MVLHRPDTSLVFSRTYAGAEFSVYSYSFLKKGMPFCRRSTEILLLLLQTSDMFCKFNYLCFSSHLGSCICLVLASMSLFDTPLYTLMYFGVSRIKSKKYLNWSLPMYSLKCIGHVRGQPAGIPWGRAGSVHKALLKVTQYTQLSEHYSPNTQLPSLGKVTMNKEDSTNINTPIQSQWNSWQVNLLKKL